MLVLSYKSSALFKQQKCHLLIHKLSKQAFVVQIQCNDAIEHTQYDSSQLLFMYYDTSQLPNKFEFEWPSSRTQAVPIYFHLTETKSKLLTLLLTFGMSRFYKMELLYQLMYTTRHLHRLTKKDIQNTYVADMMYIE